MRQLAFSKLLLISFGLHASAISLFSYASETADQNGIIFSFPEQQVAKELLSRPDTYTTTASAFDRKVRMQVAQDPGTQNYLKFIAAQVLPWKESERKTIQAAIDNLRPQLNALSITLEDPVNLIHTTGKEESGAAYTRGNEIVFPKRELAGNPKSKTKLLAHELFHVISRQHPDLRDHLYQLIGFEKSNPIQLPASLSPLRITNPDAPVIEHVMQLRLDSGDSVHIAPMLIAKSDYDEDGASSLFAYLTFKLMQVHQTPDGWVAEQKEGEPVFHSPKTLDFHRQIGKNTGYIIHPEEILADNFALIMTNGKVTDTWLTEKMKSAIKTHFEHTDSVPAKNDNP